MPASWRSLAYSFLLALMAVLTLAGRAQVAAADEVRALWVVRTTMTSPEAIDALIDSARDGGFNTLIVQVRGRGDAYFAGGLEPRAAALRGQPASFDPLAYTLSRARSAGLRVHAWVNVNLVAGIADLPVAPGHIVRRHPEWLMVPRELAADLAALDPEHPQYLQRLVEYIAARTDEVEGLYLSPLSQESAEYTTSVIADLARRYGVDGVHLDYARFPGEAWDYSASAMSAFRSSVLPDLSPDERARLDRRLRDAPTVYADMFPERWARFRRDRLTRLVVSIRDAVKAVRPQAVFSAAVFPDPGDAVSRRYQDWPGWLLYGVLDVVCPMAYTTSPDVFASQIAGVRRLTDRGKVWGGVGAWRLADDELAARVRLARSLDVGGVVLFSYDSLAEAGTGRVVTAGRNAFH